jgi:hypothetical protein
MALVLTPMQVSRLFSNPYLISFKRNKKALYRIPVKGYSDSASRIIYADFPT